MHMSGLLKGMLRKSGSPKSSSALARQWALVVTAQLALVVFILALHALYGATFGIPRDVFIPLLSGFASLFGLLIAVTSALTAFVMQSGFNAWYTNIANLHRVRESLKRSTAISELTEYPQAVHSIEQLLTMSEGPTVVGRSSVYDWHKVFPEVLTALRHVSADLKTKNGSGPDDADAVGASTSTVVRQIEVLAELVEDTYAVTNSRVALDGVALYMGTARQLVSSIGVYAVALAVTLGALIVMNLEGLGHPSNHGRFDVAVLLLFGLVVGLLFLANAIRTHLDTIKLTHIPYGELD